MAILQVLNPDLACASYLVVSAGEAAVVDPRLEVEEYLRLAAEAGAAVVHVLETHVHADHVSGRGRLAAATGAAVHLPAGSGAGDPHRPLRDGDVLAVGEARMVVLATPGHRPEHVSLLVREGGEPASLLTGDSLLVGDVARPDLAGDAEAGARALFASLRRLEDLGDEVAVLPGHVGGSLCGGGTLRAEPASTIGRERATNRSLRIRGEEAFVAALTADLPARPPGVEAIVARNRAPRTGSHSPLIPLSPRDLGRLREEGATVVDGRPASEFDACHVAGAICLPLDRAGVGTRAGWALDPAVPVVVTAADGAGAERLAELLRAVGIEDVRGVLDGGVGAWREAGGEVGAISAMALEEVAAALAGDRVVLLDVREPREWEDGHVARSVHVPLPALDATAATALDRGRPVVVACAGGTRSAVAASLVARAGHPDVRRMARGGVPDLARILSPSQSEAP